MNNFIKINLNQTVSKTELKEKRADGARWFLFAAIIIAFLGLIGFQSFVIIKTNKLSDDTIAFKQFLNEKIDDVEEEILAEEKARDKKLGKISKKTNNKPVKNTSFEDIQKLKKFEMEKRIFWGPKLISLIKLLPDDVAVTSIEFTKGENFKMEVFARYEDMKIDQQTLYNKGANLILGALKNDKDFFRGFKTLEYEKGSIEKKKKVELGKFTYKGTFKKVIDKSKKKKKKSKKK